MIIGILKESLPEKRVSLLPEAISQLNILKVSVLVEKSAGELANASDEAYHQAGAKVVDKKELYAKAALFLMINPPAPDDLKLIGNEKILVGTLNPLSNVVFVKNLKEAGFTAFSLDAIPRISRAQAMDVLSSMATVAGYRAILDAAFHLPTFFPMFMSAAGTIKPAKVLILGAGVAGLQAIATARKLGAVVEAFDVRSAVKEEVQSLGAKFVEVEGAVDDASAGGYAVEQTEEFKQRQSQMIQDHAIKSDVVICTAQIPGRKAPLLIKKQTVSEMKAGSVIIDLAASSGGNCELTQNDKTVIAHGVKIIGNSNYPSGMPVDASRMYGKNLINFLKLMIDEEGGLKINFEDEIIKGACITHQGEIINERVKSAIENTK
ncbi:MAG: Re/Si-specific NAD(P)(+) transhydrogenase subunit alpha [Bacteroidales bacterium]|nr:Re/Si-specific NAD(P)(+) transhydrogenase subunit alpha [Bacteroidales bacterium]MCF8403690.1 Re/Si-specific NAD(P)(+) transhydrogenase subunit alpha [Bacteroidales bacterium]